MYEYRTAIMYISPTVSTFGASCRLSPSIKPRSAPAVISPTSYLAQVCDLQHRNFEQSKELANKMDRPINLLSLGKSQNIS
jgi:hypothetical protein